MIRRRAGMALAMTIGVVSLIAILAVATLSLATRLEQGTKLGARDVTLDGVVAFGLASPAVEWRRRGFGRLAIGATVSFAPAGSGPAEVAVTRVSREVFWIVATSAGPGDARRRENLIVRVRSPNARALLDDDSTNVATLGFISVDSLAATADLTLPSGAVVADPTGVVHVTGDATIPGGSGSGILIVSGKLMITGPFAFDGIVVARQGLSVAAPGFAVTGFVRAAGPSDWLGEMALTESETVVQDVLGTSLMPKPVQGRRWSEMY